MSTKKAKRTHVYKKGYQAGHRVGYNKAKKKKAEKQALAEYDRLIRKYRSQRRRLDDLSLMHKPAGIRCPKHLQYIYLRRKVHWGGRP
jgi:flagellar biosynthesis/type III secretory pathway protein FliH